MKSIASTPIGWCHCTTCRKAHAVPSISRTSCFVSPPSTMIPLFKPIVRIWTSHDVPWLADDELRRSEVRVPPPREFAWHGGTAALSLTS
jgi:hypothetical protein